MKLGKALLLVQSEVSGLEIRNLYVAVFIGTASAFYSADSDGLSNHINCPRKPSEKENIYLSNAVLALLHTQTAKIINKNTYRNELRKLYAMHICF